ncbi:hypothetical protein AND_010559 [Anopheles darlingi]|uniref:Ig-like domain-containing protein n=1 Tax=Anopheles darlingi TaxID=43151 RepID=W5J150_ANODA|nr:hypothetical protein AND_010559 [Anopheles darlingi]
MFPGTQQGIPANNALDTEAHQLQTPQENKVVKKFYPHPYFDFDVPRNITTRVGQTAFINCRVEQMGDKSVSWIRKRDLHILSAGTAVYTSDERFQVIRSEKAENWTLQIKFAQQRDSGIYECQVNTEPKMSMAFRLNVVGKLDVTMAQISSTVTLGTNHVSTNTALHFAEAKAVILGPTDLYVKMGSIVTLTCIISQGPHDLGTIYWYRGKRHRTRVSGELKILGAKLSDSGNYTCLPTSAEGTSVMVHVINGEHPAAMQRGCATNTITDRCRSVRLLVAMLGLLALHQCLALQTELRTSGPQIEDGKDCNRRSRWQQQRQAVQQHLPVLKLWIYSLSPYPRDRCYGAEYDDYLFAYKAADGSGKNENMTIMVASFLPLNTETECGSKASGIARVDRSQRERTYPDLSDGAGATVLSMSDCPRDDIPRTNKPHPRFMCFQCEMYETFPKTQTQIGNAKPPPEKGNSAGFGRRYVGTADHGGHHRCHDQAMHIASIGDGENVLVIPGRAPKMLRRGSERMRGQSRKPDGQTGRPLVCWLLKSVARHGRCNDVDVGLLDLNLPPFYALIDVILSSQIIHSLPDSIIIYLKQLFGKYTEFHCHPGCFLPFFFFATFAVAHSPFAGAIRMRERIRPWRILQKPEAVLRRSDSPVRTVLKWKVFAAYYVFPAARNHGSILGQKTSARKPTGPRIGGRGGRGGGGGGGGGIIFYGTVSMGRVTRHPFDTGGRRRALESMIETNRRINVTERRLSPHKTAGKKEQCKQQQQQQQQRQQRAKEIREEASPHRGTRRNVHFWEGSLEKSHQSRASTTTMLVATVEDISSPEKLNIPTINRKAAVDETGDRSRPNGKTIKRTGTVDEVKEMERKKIDTKCDKA